MCANKVVAGVRFSSRLLTIRPQNTRQFASAQQIATSLRAGGSNIVGVRVPPSAPRHREAQFHWAFFVSANDKLTKG
jgi:thiazole synthase ThiGH ThiG subunit